MSRIRGRGSKSLEVKVVAADAEVFEFDDRSGGENKFVAEGGRDGATGFELGFQMRLGGLLESKGGLATVAPVRVAAGQQSGFGNPHAIFILPELHFREWNDHNGHKVTCSALDVKEAMFPRQTGPRLNPSTPWRGEAKRRRLNPQPAEWLMSFQNGNVPKSCRASPLGFSQTCRRGRFLI
jgi:hypothetical protein